MTVALTCPYCSFSKKVPKEKIPENVRWVTCPRCQQRFDILSSMGGADYVGSQVSLDTQQQHSNEIMEKESLRKRAPWEHRTELGLWQAIYQTVKEFVRKKNCEQTLVARRPLNLSGSKIIKVCA